MSKMEIERSTDDGKTWHVISVNFNSLVVNELSRKEVYDDAYGNLYRKVKQK